VRDRLGYPALAWPGEKLLTTVHVPVRSKVQLIRRDTECGRHLFARRLTQVLFCFLLRASWLADAQCAQRLQPKVLAPCSGRRCAVRSCAHDFMWNLSTFGGVKEATGERAHYGGV
jgi:hypothetical protein